MEITIFCSPGAPPGESWGLSIAPNCPNDEYLHWADPDKLILHGFATAHDAWVFAVVNLMVDPAKGLTHKFTLNPPPIVPIQQPLF